jgi:hypothetical protein
MNLPQIEINDFRDTGIAESIIRQIILIKLGVKEYTGLYYFMIFIPQMEPLL